MECYIMINIRYYAVIMRCTQSILLCDHDDAVWNVYVCAYVAVCRRLAFPYWISQTSIVQSMLLNSYHHRSCTAAALVSSGGGGDNISRSCACVH